MSDCCLKLEGLDGSNPLAFLAALGVLQVLTDSQMSGAHEWRLSWRDEGRWLAVLHGSTDLQSIVQHLHADLALWKEELALQLAYDEDGRRVSASAKNATFDLKPSPEAFRAYADEIASKCGPERMRSVRMAAAYGSELVTDNNGRLKPTALHFTAGQQSFLSMIRALQQGLTPEDFHEALVGPWRNSSKLPSMSWNASAVRIYAYRADNPSDEKRGSVPAADWLAFVGLRFFPVVCRNSRLVTTGVRGGWKNSTMTWPIWTSALSVNAIRSLLAWRGLGDSFTRKNCSAVGISALYKSKIHRSDQGGYGSFSPASVL